MPDSYAEAGGRSKNRVPAQDEMKTTNGQSVRMTVGLVRRPLDEGEGGDQTTAAGQ